MNMSTETRETLARNVRIAMGLRGMKQKDLERKAKVSQKTVSNVLNCRQSTQLDIVSKLSAALALKPHQLLSPDLFPRELFPDDQDAA